MVDTKTKADECKANGNSFLTAGKFSEAVRAYSEGIELDSSNHILFSNRSAAHAKNRDYEAALNDANKVIELQPEWPKGYSRKGSALQFLGRFEEAKSVFEEGLKFDAGNEQLKKGLRECEDELSGRGDQGMPGENPFGNMMQIMQRLQANPKTAQYLKDPSYIAMLNNLQKDPKALGLFLQDPRMQETLSVILGIDLTAMSTDGTSSRPPPSKPTPPEEPKQEHTMETDEPDNVKKSLDEKELGNSFYKKKEFEKAIEHYDAAIELDETNVTFYTNKAAVYFEQGELVKCRETCLKAVDIGREHRADYKLIAKAFARIGNAYLKEKDYPEAITFFNKSLTEHRTRETLDKLHQCEKAVKDAERLAYINPEIALEEKNKGNDAFQSGKYPEAVKRYTEAIKRNPDDAKIYSNRAAAYMKLMEFSLALRDSEECIKKDKTFVKGHIRKGAALEAMKESTKAMDAYQKALDLDANAKEASDGYFRCLNSDMQNRNDPEAVRRRAMADPEVQEIMSDPAMKMILEQMQQDPKALRDHLKNPEIAKRIQKLMDVGLLSIR